MSGGAEVEAEEGWISPALRREFPRLYLRHLSAERSPGRRSGPAVRERLRRMSDRFTGGKAVTLRLEPVPSAYRAFFRQIGIDPESRRTPAEELALRRMHDGGYRSHGAVEDALTIAIAETGVAIVALDAGEVAGTPGLRLSRRGERLGGDERPLTGPQIVLADDSRALAVLFADAAEGVAVKRATERVMLVGVGVRGVPTMMVEEALWTAAGAMWDRA